MLELGRVVINQGAFTLSADFSVPQGQRIAVIGPSGGGKSTLLAAIGGFIPYQGAIRWHGQDMPANPAKRPISTVFQDHNLFPHLSLWQNVALGMSGGVSRGVSGNLRLTGDQGDQVNDALHKVGLSDHATSRPAQVSGGQAGRAALARVLVQNRPLVLLDEPFAALGPALRGDMLALLSQVLDHSGATALMVTHAPQDAQIWADHVIWVDQNIAHPPQDISILQNPDPAMQAYLG